MSDPLEESEGTLEVGREHHGCSLLDFLDSHLGPLDRPAVRTAARHEQLLLNGEAAGPSVTLRLGDQVRVLCPAEALARRRPERIDVLHRDEGLVVAVKPAGMPFDAGRQARGDSALELLREQTGEARPRPVHRLDRDTSGLVVAALDRQTEQALTDDFLAGRARVEYLALVRGTLRETAGEVAMPLGKGKKSESTLRADPDRGRAAFTRWSVEEALRGFALLRLVPDGGRSHQVRAHLAVLGHPALCDRDYGEDDRILLSQLKLHYRRKRGRPERPLLQRPAVHAARFVRDGLTVEAPLPDDLEVVLAQLRRLRPARQGGGDPS